MLKRDIVMIELGSSHVKMGLARYTKGVVHVQDAFMVELPDQTYVDGQIVEAEVLRSRVFNEMIERSIKAKEAYLTLNGSHIITREITLPEVREEEIEEMIMYEVQQYMPINLDDYHIEYKILEHFSDGEMAKIRVFVAGVSKEEVDAYYKFLLSLQLRPVVMDINGNAISKLFGEKTRVNNGEPLGDRKIALIDFGSHSINVTVVHKGVLQLSRLVDAEEILGMVEDSDSLTEEAFSSLTAKVQRVFQFYTSRHSGSKIEQVFLLGGVSNQESLVQYFQQVFQMPVEVVTALSSVVLNGKSKSIDVKRYLNMLGCLVRDKQVNG